jgi:hypothetical protein
MGAGAAAGGAGCKVTPAASDDVQCDYHSPQGDVSFSVGIFAGKGSVSFSSFSVDGQDQPLSTTVTAKNLAAGRHKLVFVLAFSDPGATAVIREACNPSQDLVLVDASSPFETLRICVP